METLHNLKKRTVEARRELIDDGAACYPEVWVALYEFCGEIWRRLNEVLVARLPVLSKVLGLKLTEDQIEREAWPKNVTAAEGFTGNGGWLAVRLKFPDRNLHSLYVGLAWGEEERHGARPIWAQAGISAGSKVALETAWPKFQGPQAKRTEEGGARDMYFWSQVPAGKINEFQGLVERKLDELVSALKEAEGLKAFRT